MKFEGKKTFRRLLLRLSQADIVFYLLPALMLLLTVGTIEQRRLGLYEAQHLYFSSFIIWAGPIPLPGGYILMGLLTLSLAIKFLFYSEWSFKKAGIILSHFGVLILLAGGLLASLTAREGYVVLPEGGETPYVYDYLKRTLYVFENDKLILSFDFENITENMTHYYQNKLTPLSIKVLNQCKNCEIQKRSVLSQDYDPELLRGMAQFMALESKPSEKEPETNLSGLTLEISSETENQNGIYLAFEGMPKPIELQTNNRTYKIIFGKNQRLLPFSIKLTDFEKDPYPGADVARAYKSDVMILDNGAEWPATISMNKPLHYKGYSFYQSSFERTEAGESSLLSVVENKGRFFPYLGTLLVAAGLLLHFLLILRERKA